MTNGCLLRSKNPSHTYYFQNGIIFQSKNYYFYSDNLITLCLAENFFPFFRNKSFFREYIFQICKITHKDIFKNVILILKKCFIWMVTNCWNTLHKFLLLYRCFLSFFFVLLRYLYKYMHNNQEYANRIFKYIKKLKINT